MNRTSNNVAYDLLYRLLCAVQQDDVATAQSCYEQLRIKGYIDRGGIVDGGTNDTNEFAQLIIEALHHVVSPNVIDNMVIFDEMSLVEHSHAQLLWAHGNLFSRAPGNVVDIADIRYKVLGNAYYIPSHYEADDGAHSEMYVVGTLLHRL